MGGVEKLALNSLLLICGFPLISSKQRSLFPSCPSLPRPSSPVSPCPAPSFPIVTHLLSQPIASIIYPIPMISPLPVAIVCPKPVRTSQISGLPGNQANLFLSPSAPVSDSSEGLILTKEITQIFQTRGLVQPIVGNRQSPGQGRRQVQMDRQPPRCQANPLLSDPAFKEIEEKAGDFPWD